MSILDDPIAVLIACSENHRYVMVFDLRDFSAVYYRSGLESKTRGVQTNRDSLPGWVQMYFFTKGEEMCKAYNHDELAIDEETYEAYHRREASRRGEM